VQNLPPKIAGALLSATLVCASAHAVDVRGVRVWAAPDDTRVVLDLSGGASHSLAVMHNPERVVLTVPGGHIGKGARKSAPGSGAVKAVHLASLRGQLRVVLDLARPAHTKSFLAKPNDRYGYRLVIDVAKRVAPAPTRPVKVEHAPRDSRELIIAIDAGHGGEDPGAIGKNGLREKDVVLAIARELGTDVDAEPGMKAILTRSGDYFLPLRERMRRARAQSADLFVSIHADSIRDRSIDGSSVYILSQRGATDEASRWLAERENASDLIGGVSLDDKGDVLASVLLDVSQTASLRASQDAAQRVLRSLSQAGEVRKHQVQEARFMVLKSPDIPSMLVETAYISNPQEEQRLRTVAQRAKLAAAIYRGVRDYFYANPPAGTRIAQLAGANTPGGVRPTPAAPREALATNNGGAGN
jgi:N-acetylmuramoyl-L-alanine amidase